MTDKLFIITLCLTLLFIAGGIVSEILLQVVGRTNRRRRPAKRHVQPILTQCK